jgi:hypothetical protein
MAHHDDSFEDRTARAKAAREKALKLLADRPPVDEALVAQRQAARLAKEAAAAEKSAARKAALAEEKAAAAQAKADKLAASQAPAIVLPTAAELKAARDERYAARKKRKG